MKKTKTLCFLTLLALVTGAFSFAIGGREAKQVKAEEPKSESTMVLGVSSMTGSAANNWFWLGFTLSNYDYKATAGKAIDDTSKFKLSEHGNVQTNIVDGDGKALTFDSARKDRYKAGETASTFWIYLTGADPTNPPFTKVTVKSGTQFVSKACAFGEGDAATRTDYYVTGQDVSFTFNSTTKKWDRVIEESQKVETSVLTMDIIPQDNVTTYFYIKLGLSAYDWVKPAEGEGGGTLQNVTWYVDILTNLYSSVYADDALITFDNPRGTRFRCAYGAYIIIVKGNPNEVAFNSLTVKAGALFPSKQMGMGNATEDLTEATGGFVGTEIKYYVAKEDAKFIKDDDPSLESVRWVLTSVYAQELADGKTSAITAIEGYKGGANNFKTNKTAYEAAIADAKTAINAAENKVALKTALEAGKTAIDGIKDDATLLNEKKTARKADLDTYYNEIKGARTLKSSELDKAYADGKVAITNATSETLVEEAFTAAKAAMGAVKTDEVIRGEYVEKIDAEKAKVAEKKYSDENKAKLDQLVADAKAAVATATSISALDGIITKLAADIAAIPEAKGGCGGSIIAASALVSLAAIAGASLLVFKKKED